MGLDCREALLWKMLTEGIGFLGREQGSIES